MNLLGSVLEELRHRTARLARAARRLDHRHVRLEPEGEARHNVLYSYVIDPLLDPGAPPALSHTHFWESRCIAETLVDLGCRVDAIHWTNDRFEPSARYDLVIDVRTNLERWSDSTPGAFRLLHCDTAYWEFNNAAERARLDALAERRGTRLRARRQMPASSSPRIADLLTYLGNEFTRATYPRAEEDMVRIPVSVPTVYPWPDGKDFDEVRRTFLWFGSGGLVHKGLDLVLEAFAGLPDHRLLICGPVLRERDFAREYTKELAAPNVELLGWVDVASERFLRIARRCVALIYPSCSEGGGASALTCMHAGMVPMLTREASVDLDADRGVVLDDVEPGALRDAVRAFSDRPPPSLEAMARSAWSWAREHHCREVFARRFRAFATDLLENRLLDSRPSRDPDTVQEGPVEETT